MKMSEGFEMVNIADDHLVVPVGKKADTVKGVIIVSPDAAFLLEKMKTDISLDDLVTLLTDRYDVGKDKAKEDIIEMIDSLRSMGLIIE